MPFRPVSEGAQRLVRFLLNSFSECRALGLSDPASNRPARDGQFSFDPAKGVLRHAAVFIPQMYRALRFSNRHHQIQKTSFSGEMRQHLVVTWQQPTRFKAGDAVVPTHVFHQRLIRLANPSRLVAAMNARLQEKRMR